MSDRPILLIDGLNVFMRHFIANPAMSEMGDPIGGVIGFLKNIKHLVESSHPSEVVVVWEGGGSLRKRAIFKDYKQRRKPQKLNRYYEDLPNTVENRNDQVSMIVNLLKHVPVRQVYVENCEADDVIGYLVKYKYRLRRCVIISSDKDYYQLLDRRVIQWSPGQKKYILPTSIVQKFHVSFVNFCTARAFIGDASDNLPGIKGAGFKTISKRFPELVDNVFVSVEDIIKMSASRAVNSKIQLYKRICEGADVARRNWKLMHLDTNNLSASQVQKIEATIDTFMPSRDKIALMKSLKTKGITSFDVDSFFMSLNIVGK